jgi:hypothetical protein
MPLTSPDYRKAKSIASKLAPTEVERCMGQLDQVVQGS